MMDAVYFIMYTIYCSYDMLYLTVSITPYYYY